MQLSSECSHVAQLFSEGETCGAAGQVRYPSVQLSEKRNNVAQLSVEEAMWPHLSSHVAQLYPLGEGTHVAQAKPREARDAAVSLTSHVGLIQPGEAAVMFIQQREAAVSSI